MKSLIIIWVAVLITLIGGTIYMNHAINGMIERVPENSVRINYCNTNGMVVLTANKCHISGFNSLEVINNYQEQKTANINLLEPKVSDAYLQGAY